MAGCRCGGPESLSKPRRKWYQSTGFLIMAVLGVGPLALPLVWSHPRRTAASKFLWTVAILLGTVVLGYAFRDALVTTWERLKVLKGEMGI